MSMTPEQYIYWLRGYLEGTGKRPSLEQMTIIKNTLEATIRKPLVNTLTGTGSVTISNKPYPLCDHVTYC